MNSRENFFLMIDAQNPLIRSKDNLVPHENGNNRPEDLRIRIIPAIPSTHDHQKDAEVMSPQIIKVIVVETSMTRGAIDHHVLEDGICLPRLVHSTPHLASRDLSPQANKNKNKKRSGRGVRARKAAVKRRAMMSKQAARKALKMTKAAQLIAKVINYL